MLWLLKYLKIELLCFKKNHKICSMNTYIRPKYSCQVLVEIVLSFQLRKKTNLWCIGIVSVRNFCFYIVYNTTYFFLNFEHAFR
jgi:hypothetical protein